MHKSEQIGELAAALAKAQGMMGGAKKDSENPYFKSKYADLASVVEAIREPLAANGLAYMQLPMETEREEVKIETVLLHGSGQWMSSVVTVPVAKGDAQGYGSAMTYARRYGLQALVGVAAEDDDGNAAAKAKPRPTEAEMMPRPKASIPTPGMAPAPADELAPERTEPDLTPTPRMGAEGTPHPRLTRFVLNKANYSTAGMTKDQMQRSFGLVTMVNDRYGKGKAEGVLREEFGVVTRSDLTEEAAEKYLIRLMELKEAL